MSVCEKNINEWAQEPMQRLGLIQMELMDIKRQQKALYVSEKQKEEEAKAIYEQILAETREGKAIFRKGE